MKNILLVFVLTIMTVQAQKFIPNEVYKTSLASCKLNGNIKKISSKFYCLISNDSILNQWRKFATDSIASKVFLASINEREFSMNGYKTLESQGRFYFKNELVYSSNKDAEDNNNTQQQLAFRLNDSTNIAYKFSKSTHSFIYNNSGNLKQVKQLGFDTINGYGCDFIYNEKGDLIASKFWGNKNSLTNAYENKYDEKDRLIEVESYLYWINEFNTSKYKYFPQEKNMRFLLT